MRARPAGDRLSRHLKRFQCSRCVWNGIDRHPYWQCAQNSVIAPARIAADAVLSYSQNESPVPWPLPNAARILIMCSTRRAVFGTCGNCPYRKWPGERGGCCRSACVHWSRSNMRFSPYLPPKTAGSPTGRLFLVDPFPAEQNKRNKHSQYFSHTDWLSRRNERGNEGTTSVSAVGLRTRVRKGATTRGSISQCAGHAM